MPLTKICEDFGMEGRISVLLEMGMDYPTVKAIVPRRPRIAV